MLVHPWDAPLDDAEVRSFVERQGFGHLVAVGGQRVPVIAPTQYVLDVPAPGVDGWPHVLLHLARPNPIWAAIERDPLVVLSVAGEWSYVPSAWKAIGDEDPSLGIPTTYYAAAQLCAHAEIVDDPDGKLAILRRQIGLLEPDGGWADPSVHLRRLSGIRGLRLTVEQVDGKFKYGGNVDAAHRLAVADRLAERAGPGDAAAREHLLRRLERSGQDPQDTP